jgi:prepilin-type processing-associated H-X9-DG protein
MQQAKSLHRPRPEAATCWDGAVNRGIAQISLKGLFRAVTLLAVGLYVLVYIVQRPRIQYRVDHCRAQLRQIWTALAMYEITEGAALSPFVLDNSGRRIHSWRASLLPHLDVGTIANSYDFEQPWDVGPNRQLRNSIPGVYVCPSYAGDERTETSATSYLAILGDTDNRSTGVEVVSRRDAPSILAILELRGTTICWTEPRDLTLEETNQLFESRSGREMLAVHAGSFNILFADGTIETLSANIECGEFWDLVEKHQVLRAKKELNRNRTGD